MRSFNQELYAINIITLFLQDYLKNRAIFTAGQIKGLRTDSVWKDWLYIRPSKNSQTRHLQDVKNTANSSKQMYKGLQRFIRTTLYKSEEREAQAEPRKRCVSCKLSRSSAL